MNEKQIGPFIKSLREEKNLNQEQLGEILSVHRTTVNKWEKGKSIPLNDTLVLLSEFFDVSIDEILAGERFNKDDISKNNEVVLSLLTKRRKLMKKVVYIGSLLFIVTSVFLIYYFFTTYNTLHVYRLKAYNEDTFYNSTGLLVLSRDKSYMKFGSVYNKYNEIIKVDKIDIYYKDKEDKINVLYNGPIKGLIVDFSHNMQHINIKDLNSNKYDFYLRIYFGDQVEELRLIMRKDFNNDALLYNEENLLVTENLSTNIINNIKNNKKFIYDESNFSYVYQTKNLKMELYEELNTFRIHYVKNKIEVKYVYDLLDNTLEYRKTNNGVIREERFMKLENIKTDEEKKIYNDFKKNYIDKYLK